MRIDFTIPGPPKGKARARTLKNGHSFTPADTVAYENLVKLCYREKANGSALIEGPVQVWIRAYFPIPKSASKKRTEEMRTGALRPVVKPDCDNIAKIVCDALNNIAYRDDSQVTCAVVVKEYADIPRVEVEIAKIMTNKRTK